MAVLERMAYSLSIDCWKALRTALFCRLAMLGMSRSFAQIAALPRQFPPWATGLPWLSSLIIPPTALAWMAARWNWSGEGVAPIFGMGFLFGVWGRWDSVVFLDFLFVGIVQEVSRLFEGAEGEGGFGGLAPQEKRGIGGESPPKSRRAWRNEANAAERSEASLRESPPTPLHRKSSSSRGRVGGSLLLVRYATSGYAHCAKALFPPTHALSGGFPRTPFFQGGQAPLDPPSPSASML